MKGFFLWTLLYYLYGLVPDIHGTGMLIEKNGLLLS